MMTAHRPGTYGCRDAKEERRRVNTSGPRRTDVRKLLIKTLWAAALSGLVVGAVGFTTQTAKANTSSLYACDYSTQNSYTGVWDFPGGPSRPGNKTNDHTYSTGRFQDR
jgi:hypothetical protein